MKKYSLWLFILFTFFSVTTQAQETLPPYHWANNYIDYLKVRGHLPELSVLNRPYHRTTLAKQLLALEMSELSGTEQKMVSVLYNEFSPELNLLGSIPGEKWRSLLEKALDFLKLTFAPEWEHPALKAGFFGEASYLESDDASLSNPDFRFHSQFAAYWRDRLTLYSNIVFFNNAPDNYIGKEYNELYGYNEQSFISYHHDWFQAKLGRDFLQTGPGRSGQLLFSDNSRPFDMYHVMLSSRFLQFSFFGIQLDESDVVNGDNRLYDPIYRYINGHRLSLNINDKYFFGLSEVILYSGIDRPWELGLMNPLMFYYAYSVNMERAASLGNLLYSIDWDLYFARNLEFYGELMIDDIQVDAEVPSDLEPNEYGLIAGLNWADPLNFSGGMLNLEYTQVRNRTYNVQTVFADRFLHRNEEIGHSLGNNFERYGLGYTHWILPELSVKLSGSIVRQGEGSVDGEFNTDFLNATIEEGYSEAFPFGIVEKHTSYGLSLFYKPHNLGHVFLELNQDKLSNFQHTEGAEFSDFTLRAGFWLQWHHLWQW